MLDVWISMFDVFLTVEHQARPKSEFGASGVFLTVEYQASKIESMEVKVMNLHSLKNDNHFSWLHHKPYANLHR
jgi:hypothetical protein